jgi:aryl-alcohol dehydrogenase-like predicted oxidoreductase
MKLALGTVQFGLNYGISNYSGQVHIDEARKILKFAGEMGIDSIDTASGYGESEKILGDIGVNGFKVVTKTVSLRSGVKNVLDSFHQSLIDLNLSRVDGLLIHDINDIYLKEFETLFIQLMKLKKNNQINKIGFSVYTPNQVDYLLDNFDFDLIQVPFNIFDTRLIDGKQLQRLKHKGVEIHARSIFLQGILLTSPDKRPKYFDKYKEIFNAWDEWLKDIKVSSLEAAVNFAYSEALIDKVIIGVTNLVELDEIINAINNLNLNLNLNFDINTFRINAEEELINPSLWKI